MRRFDEATFIRLFFTYVHLQGRQSARMSLDSVEVAELLELSEVFESSAGGDRRLHHRLALCSTVKLKCGSWICRCMTINISGGGLLVSSDEGLDVGARVCATLSTDDTDFVFTCEVVRRHGDSWALGFVGVPLELHHGRRRHPAPVDRGLTPAAAR